MRYFTTNISFDKLQFGTCPFIIHRRTCKVMKVLGANEDKKDKKDSVIVLDSDDEEDVPLVQIQQK